MRVPLPLLATGAMVLLAALDLAGALLARAWFQQRSAGLFVAGAAVFICLFWVYATSLRYAELATVTIGWIVLLQVGLVVLDRLQLGVPVGVGRGAAVAAILALEAYLVLGPSASGS